MTSETKSEELDFPTTQVINKEKKRPPEIMTQPEQLVQAKETRDATPTKVIRAEANKETASSGDDSVNHLGKLLWL